MAASDIIPSTRKGKGSPVAKNKRTASKIAKNDHKKESVKENSHVSIAILEGLLPKNSENSFLVDLKNNITRRLAEPVIIDYLKTIKKKKLDLLKLAYKMNGDVINVWVEIKDKDDKTRKKLILIDSEINNRHYPATQIFLDSIIVEERDNYPIPKFYQSVNFWQ